MKRAILFLSSILLLACFSLAPVLAAGIPAHRVPVREWSTGSAGSTTGEVWTTPGGVIQTKGATITYPTYLEIDGATPLEGISTNTFSQVRNTNEGILVVQYDADWYYASEKGGFKGNVEATVTGMTNPVTPPVMMNLHTVLHGYGSFEGQILMLSYEGKYSSKAIWTGTLLIP